MKDIEEAVEAFRVNAARYARAERYYNGEHDLKFATEKFENTFGELFREFALNLCPVVCDAVKDKLRVKGFSTESGETGQDAAARAVWRRNRMGVRAGEVHKESLKCGDAYMIVWPDEAGKAVIYPNRAASLAVKYDGEAPGRVLRAAKYWRDDKHIRLNVFYPDRIERYVSRNEHEGSLPEARDFVPYSDRGGEKAVVANPYDVVPVFHFANNSDVGWPGRSELDAAMPIQDGLNKAVLDMLVAMEFSAFRQRWAAGIEVEYGVDGKAVVPFKSGVDSLWVAGDPNARFGDFEAAELEQFLKVKDSFRVDIASVTGTPLHYFLQEANSFPSGESLRQASARFIAKVRDRQVAFGQVWADAMALALKIEGRGDAELLTQWEDPSPLSEREMLENLILKHRLGLPAGQLLREAGYGGGAAANGAQVQRQ